MPTRLWDPWRAQWASWSWKQQSAVGLLQHTKIHEIGSNFWPQNKRKSVYMMCVPRLHFTLRYPTWVMTTGRFLGWTSRVEETGIRLQVLWQAFSGNNLEEANYLSNSGIQPRTIFQILQAAHPCPDGLKAPFKLPNSSLLSYHFGQVTSRIRPIKRPLSTHRRIGRSSCRTQTRLAFTFSSALSLSVCLSIKGLWTAPNESAELVGFFLSSRTSSGSYSPRSICLTNCCASPATAVARPVSIRSFSCLIPFMNTRCVHKTFLQQSPDFLGVLFSLDLRILRRCKIEMESGEKFFCTLNRK